MSRPTGQYLAVMNMKYYESKTQRTYTRSFGPYASRSGAAAKKRALIRDIKEEIKATGMMWDSLEPLRYDSVEYTFTTSELWTPSKA